MEAEGAAPRTIGELRKELVDSYEASASPAQSTGAGSSGDGSRAAVATALLCAYYEKRGENTQWIGGLVRQFEAFYEAFESMVEGGGREALVTRVKESESKVRDTHLEMDMLRKKNRDLEERVVSLSNRLVVNGMPV